MFFLLLYYIHYNIIIMNNIETSIKIRRENNKLSFSIGDTNAWVVFDPTIQNGSELVAKQLVNNEYTISNMGRIMDMYYSDIIKVK